MYKELFFFLSFVLEFEFTQMTSQDSGNFPEKVPHHIMDLMQKISVTKEHDLSFGTKLDVEDSSSNNSLNSFNQETGLGENVLEEFQKKEKGDGFITSTPASLYQPHISRFRFPQGTTLLTKTAAQNEAALGYHRVRGLYFLAVVFAATITSSYF